MTNGLEGLLLHIRTIAGNILAMLPTNDGTTSLHIKDSDMNTVVEIDSDGNTTLAAAAQLRLRDTALLVHSSADGQLDIDADVEVEITAPTLDIDAATAVTVDTTTMAVTGTLALTGNMTVTGTVDTVDLQDHSAQHDPGGSDALTTAAPAADSVNVSASAEGSGSSFARADHTHNLDESIAPSWTGNHTFADNAWIGLGAAAGRIEFDDQSTDEINFLACRVGIGTSTPAQELEIASASPVIRLTDTTADSMDVDMYLEANKFHFTDTSSIYLMTWTSAGDVGIGTQSPGGKVEIDQAAAGGAIPCLVLDQADVDQPYIEFQSATLYTGKGGVDEYVKVKNSAGATRYLMLYEDP